MTNFTKTQRLIVNPADFTNIVTNEMFEEYMQRDYCQSIMAKIRNFYKNLFKIEYDEAYQLSLLGLWTALGTFDKSKSNFETHLFNHVTWTFKSYNRYKEKSNAEALQVDINILNNYPTKSSNVFMSDLENIKNIADYDLFIAVRENGKTLEQVAKEIGISDQWVNVRIHRFEAKARKILRAYE